MRAKVGIQRGGVGKTDLWGDLPDGHVATRAARQLLHDADPPLGAEAIDAAPDLCDKAVGQTLRGHIHGAGHFGKRDVAHEVVLDEVYGAQELEIRQIHRRRILRVWGAIKTDDLARQTQTHHVGPHHHGGQ